MGLKRFQPGRGTARWQVASTDNKRIQRRIEALHHGQSARFEVRESGVGGQRGNQAVEDGRAHVEIAMTESRLNDTILKRSAENRNRHIATESPQSSDMLGKLACT